MSKLLFRFTDDELIVANSGRPFSRSGLEAVCSSHLSNKEHETDCLFGDVNDARKAVDEIRERELKVYGISRPRVESDGKSEYETARDYTSRVLLELMQNADDAAAEQPIGYKGLGFKSVLGVCKSVCIHSGHLRVRFDRDHSKRSLEEKGICDSQYVPLLRLPFWDDSSIIDCEVNALQQAGYDTVIVLPWENALTRDAFIQEWDTASKNVSILLFLHSLSEVTWERQGGPRIVWKCKRTIDRIDLTVCGSENESEPETWKIFRAESTKPQSAIAVLSDSAGVSQRTSDEKLRVFFPTEERVPLAMLMHGEFDLEQNRKHVREAGTREEIVQSLAQSAHRAIVSLQDDGQILDFLRPRVSPDDMESLEREIWDAIKELARDLVLPISKIKLSDVRLCPKDSIASPLKAWEGFKDLLSIHRPGALGGLNLLAPGIEKDEHEATVCAFNEHAHLTFDELRQLKLFPVAGRDEPVAVSDCHLFIPPDDFVPTPALSEFGIQVLDDEFAAELDDSHPAWVLIKKLGLTEFTLDRVGAVLDEDILERMPPDRIWDFLVSTVAPMLKDGDAVMNWKDGQRLLRAERVQVPCRDGWRAAINVYAGKEWTGQDFLEHAYESQKFFLAPPSHDEHERKRFELLARWLGVGWSPKVLPVRDLAGIAVAFADEERTMEGVKFDRFSGLKESAHWKAHCNKLDDGQNERRKARVRQDWTIDGDAKVLQFEGAFDCITREWSAYKTYLEAVLYRSSNEQQDYDNVRRSGKSYVRHLFECVAWLPTGSPGVFVSANDVFDEDGEVSRALTGWVSSLPLTVKEHIAKAIGIRSHWRDVKTNDWVRWLGRALNRNPNTSEDDRKQIVQLYTLALRKASSAFGNALRVWSINKRTDNTNEWDKDTPPRDVYYVDRPDLSRLRLETLRTFPVELNELQGKARNLFAIRPLSEYLRGDASFDVPEDGTSSNKVLDRLHSRRKCLAAYLNLKYGDSQGLIPVLQEFTLRTGDRLRVTFQLPDGAPQTVESPVFFQPRREAAPPVLWLESKEHFTDQGPRDIAWEEVGQALCYMVGKDSQDGTIFASLLSCGEDSLKRKLLNLGITENEVADALPPIQPTIPAPTPPPAVNPDPGPISGGGGATGGGKRPDPVEGGGGHWNGGGTGGHGGGGGGGEGQAHRKLKDRLWENPELIEAGMQRHRYEPNLESHYRPDLVLKDKENKFVVVEVESSFPNNSDYGVWQAVAYKHVAAVELRVNCDDVRGLLVAPQIPQAIKSKCAELRIEAVELDLTSAQ